MIAVAALFSFCHKGEDEMVETTLKPVLYRGAEEICQVIKVDRKKIPNLVKNEGLPAWQKKNGGVYYALHEDLLKWARTQRDKYLNTVDL